MSAAAFRAAMPPEPPADSPPAEKPPRCAMCRGRMEVTRREPGPNGSQRLTFLCPKCQFTKTKTIGDPMDAGRHRPRKGK
ncbi:MAG: hypothetical protein H7312_12310 [Tardiphaga sp.]|nr:hypothetical protein [Tardiphaga sp.]